MKHLKTPTKKQKLLIASSGLNPNSWQIERILKDEMVIVHKVSGKKKGIKKQVKA